MAKELSLLPKAKISVEKLGTVKVGGIKKHRFPYYLLINSELRAFLGE